MSIAVRIARASTRRDRVAFCGYHGWNDWYLAANLDDAGDGLGAHLIPGLDPAGVPQGLKGTAIPFTYNQVDELHAIAKRHGTTLAAVVMEPTRSAPPANGFLESVREIANSCGAKLIFDEISSGFRLGMAGAHLRYGVMPDIAVFAKALANGIPMAAIIGRANVMQAAQDSFISSTFWTEGLGPAAALATIEKLTTCRASDHAAAIGRHYRRGLAELAVRHGVPLTISGHDQLLGVSFLSPKAKAIQTLLTVRMLDRGFLSGGRFYPSLAHTAEHVERFLAAADEVFGELRIAIERGDIEARVGGPIHHSGFSRLA